MAKSKDDTPKKPEPVLFCLDGTTIENPKSFDPEEMLSETYDGSDWVSNYDPSSEEHIEMCFLADQKGTIDVESAAAKKLPVRYWSCQRRKFIPKDDSDPRTGVTLCLVTPDGHTLTISSDVVLRFWKKVLLMRGVGPWSEPIHVCLEKKAASQGRKMIQLRIVSAK